MDNSLVSIYILAPLLAWFVAQCAKVVVSASKTKNKDLSLLVKSGGMPSSHSSVVAALVTVLGVRQGVGSAVFGVAVILAAIVIYDAVNVRRSVGEQGEVLQKVAKSTGENTDFYKARGHLPTEVVAGLLVGFAIALVLLQIL